MNALGVIGHPLGVQYILPFLFSERPVTYENTKEGTRFVVLVWSVPVFIEIVSSILDFFLFLRVG